VENSTAEERQHVIQTSKNVEEWLDDNGYAATVDELKEKIASLTESARPVFDRIEDLRKQKEAEEMARKLQEELEKLAQLNATILPDANETTTEVPELEDAHVEREGVISEDEAHSREELKTEEPNQGYQQEL
jgi:KaiC/GvpD/RAD55 family RecA-like ATPase